MRPLPRNCFFWLMMVVGFLLIGGCSTAPTVNPVDATTAQSVERYIIGPGDSLEIFVRDNPTLTTTVPVRPDGRITVPLIGDVEAGGHTPEEVAAVIKEKLQSYVRDPQVAVILTQLRSHEYLSRVRVTGAVRTPVSVPYRQGMTVLDAVLAAGGTTEFAAPDRTELYRKSDDATTKSYAVHLGDILQKGALDTDYRAQPGIFITVGQRSF